MCLPAELCKKPIFSHGKCTECPWAIFTRTTDSETEGTSVCGGGGLKLRDKEKEWKVVVEDGSGFNISAAVLFLYNNLQESGWPLKGTTSELTHFLRTPLHPMGELWCPLSSVLWSSSASFCFGAYLVLNLSPPRTILLRVIDFCG